MTAAKFGSVQKFLIGFFIAGLLLIAASWLITGNVPPAWNAAPFALLFVVWLGLRVTAAQGNDDAR